MTNSSHQPIILFDGVCNLCNAAVQRVIKHDPDKRFKLGSLQSEKGQEILNRYQLDHPDLSSFVLIENNKAYTRSTAALRVARSLKGLWSLLYGFIIVPPFIRDRVYNFIAKNRYRWFGKKDSCMIPEAGVKDRFID